MSLKFALLGIIDTRGTPISGYDLKKTFDASSQFYWNATYTAIYKALDQLYQDGLLSMELIQQQTHPNKKVYQVTPAGKQALKQWVGKPFELQRVRNEMLVQLTLAERLEDEQIVTLLEDYIAKVKGKLAELRSDSVQAILSRARTEKERFLWGVSLGKGEATYEKELAWAEGVLAEYKAHFVD